MKTTSIKISEALHRAAKTAAIAAGISFQEWTANAFKSYLKNKSKP